MNRKAAPQPKYKKVIAAIIASLVVIWSVFTIKFGLFCNPPGAFNDMVFIAEARDYYFDKSNYLAKKQAFDASIFKDLWLSVSGVSKVVTTYEMKDADIDVFEADYIRLVTINNETIDIDKYPRLAPSEQKLCNEILNQVSAAAWEQEKEFLKDCCVIVAAHVVVLVAWLIYLKHGKSSLRESEDAQS